MQQLIQRCVAENRLPTDFEVAAEAVRTMAALKENRARLLDSGPEEGRERGLAILDAFDPSDERSCHWADGLVVHRFGDHLPDAADHALGERLEDRLHAISDRLAADPDHIDVIEWLVASADSVAPFAS